MIKPKVFWLYVSLSSFNCMLV